MARRRSNPKSSYVQIKHHIIASLGEFVGTFLFLFFAFAGTQTAQYATAPSSSGPNLDQLLYISLIFGFSLTINVWVFFRVSGGLFNPAVTLALCIVGANPITRSIFIFLAQILGAISAAAVVKGIIPGDEVTFAVKLAPNTTIAQGLFIEMFLTILLVFSVLMLAAEKTKATFVAPVGIGISLFVAELGGVYWTGGALNPARAFGPAVVKSGFNGYDWIYWVGPLLGALLSALFYKLLKVLHYEEVNGDQDKAADEEKNLEREVSHEPEHDADLDLEAGRPVGTGSTAVEESHTNDSGATPNGNGRSTDFIKQQRGWKRKFEKDLSSRRGARNSYTSGGQTNSSRDNPRSRQEEDIGFANPKAQRRSFYDDPPNPTSNTRTHLDGHANIDPIATIPPHDTSVESKSISASPSPPPPVPDHYNQDLDSQAQYHHQSGEDEEYPQLDQDPNRTGKAQKRNSIMERTHPLTSHPAARGSKEYGYETSSHWSARNGSSNTGSARDRDRGSKSLCRPPAAPAIDNGSTAVQPSAQLGSAALPLSSPRSARLGNGQYDLRRVIDPEERRMKVASSRPVDGNDELD